MHSIKTVALLIAVLVASASTSVAAGLPTRHLRVQHNGEDHSQPAAVSAPVTLTNTASQIANPTTVSSTTVSITPGAASNNIQVNPGSVSTSVSVTPGQSSAVYVPASAPVSAIVPAAPVPAAGAGAAPAGAVVASQPSSPGFNLGLLNPITMVATLAHTVHGALLGHTNTLPSSYMQSHPGGPSHH